MRAPFITSNIFRDYPLRAEFGLEHVFAPGSVLIALVVLIHLNPAFALGVLIIAVFAWTAWYFPGFTLVVTIGLGQVLQHELAQIFGISPDGLNAGGINVRLSDPPLAGIAIATVLRLLKGRGLIVPLMMKVWAFFLAYLAFEVMRNIGVYGINAVGEFRTYWHFVLLLPYVVVSSETPERRLSILKLLILLSLFNLLWAVFRGGVLHGFGFSAYDKWLSSFGSLSLVYGAFALVLLRRSGALSLGTWTSGLIFSSVAAVVVIAGSRSVWLAAAVGFAMLVRSRMTLRNAGFASLVAILSVALLIVPFSISGIDPTRFLTDRLLALTNFQQDPTSAWRYYFWIATIETILDHPWLGTGFGPHFDIFVKELNEVFTTSPHNLYLTLLSQTGILGLVLYGWLVISLGRSLMRVPFLTGTDQVIARISFIVLISLHVYAIAFSFEKDFTSWALIGVGLAASVDSRRHANTEATVELPG